jgi:chemotaxis protein methyltransferase CheR
MSVLAGWRVEIIATDLSQEVLRSPRPASTASSRSARPIQLLVKHFKQNASSGNSPEIRAMAGHWQLNLLHDFSQLGALTSSSAAF